MLVLTRKLQESVVVRAGDVSQPMLSITVVEITGGRVRLGFEADSAVYIHRLEAWRRMQGNVQPIVPPQGPGPPDSDEYPGLPAGPGTGPGRPSDTSG